jgi:hypothetical protein
MILLNVFGKKGFNGRSQLWAEFYGGLQLGYRFGNSAHATYGVMRWSKNSN